LPLKTKSPAAFFKADELKGFSEPPPMPSAPGRKKVVATGSYDWFHSGHVRFLEEASGYGDLYIVVGHDGEHPPAERRRPSIVARRTNGAISSARSSL